MRSEFNHPQELHLSNTKGTLFRDHAKFPVYVLEDGSFAIQWGHVFVKRKTLSALDKFIATVAKSKVLKIISSHGTEMEAVDCTETKVIDKDGKSCYWNYKTFYLYDEKKLAEMATLQKRMDDLQKQIDKLENEKDKLEGKLIRVNSHNFHEMAEKHGKEK